MAQLSLSLFGPLIITRAGQPVAGFETVKARALLVYLAVGANREHSREALATLLWPELPGQAARTYLRQTLANLRDVFDDATPPYLLITRDTLQFNPASQYDLDVTTFRALLAACAEHPHRRIDTCAICLSRLEQAVALYRGSFLDQFYLRDSAPFEEWAALTREALHDQAVRALMRLGAYYERRGAYAEVEHVARQQLALDPWREEAHQQLMRALVLSGQRSAALAQFERCRALLQAELGVTPAEETRVLYQQIQSGAWLRTLAPAEPPQHSGLPASTTPLIGRTAELTALMEQLTTASCRMLTLVGPPGIGKTRLALALAQQIGDAFPDGVTFVDLTPVSEPAFVVSSIARVLGVREVSGQTPLESLGYALHERELLLLLDNFEQLMPAATDIAGLLTAAPGLTVLVTSRAVLRISGEQEYPVPALGVPDPQQLPEIAALSRYGAVELFVQRARATMPDFELTIANAAPIAEICVRLDGLPLAIELAAGRSRLFGPHALLARLDNRLQFLTGGARDLPERHQTIRNTIAWSYRLLDDAQQQLFRRLAVFASGCAIAAVETVCQANGDTRIDALAGLSMLVEQSLVRPVGDGDGELRFTMLETIREYAVEQLVASGEELALRRVHAYYYLTLAETAEPALRGPDLLGRLERLEMEHDNLRAALAWSLADTGDAELGVRLAAALGRFWFLKGHFLDLERWSARAIARIATVPAAMRETLYAKVLLSRAFCAYQVRDLTLAAALGAESLAHYEAVGDRWGSVISRIFIGIERAREDCEDVRVQLEHCVALAREVGDPWLIAFALEMLAWDAYDDKDPQLVPLYEESLMLARKVADPWLIAQILRGIGYEAGAQGNYPQATALFEECLALCENLGARRIMTWTLAGLELALIHQGEYAAARRRNAERERLEQELGNRSGVQATRWFRGRLDLLQGRLAEARACFEEYLGFARDTDYTQGIILALCSLGQVTLAQGQQAQAAQRFAQSMRLCCVHGMWRDAIQSLEGVAVIASATDPKRAARLFGAAAGQRDEHGSLFIPVIPAQYDWALATMHAKLDDATFAVEWTEGRAMTLEQAIAYALELRHEDI